MAVRNGKPFAGTGDRKLSPSLSEIVPYFSFGQEKSCTAQNPVSLIRIIFAIVVQPVLLVSDAHHVVKVAAPSCGLAYKNSSKDMLGVLAGRGAILLHVRSSLRQ